MIIQICYLQVCSSQMNNFRFSLYKCVSYDGQCIVMNVLQLFRLNIACVKKTVLVPGCSGGWFSLTRRQQFKERVGRVCGVQSAFLSPFPHSGDVKILEVGQGGTNNPLSSPDCLL